MKKNILFLIGDIIVFLAILCEIISGNAETSDYSYLFFACGHGIFVSINWFMRNREKKA